MREVVIIYEANGNRCLERASAPTVEKAKELAASKIAQYGYRIMTDFVTGDKTPIGKVLICEVIEILTPSCTLIPSVPSD